MADIRRKSGDPFPPQKQPKSSNMSASAEALSAEMARRWSTEPAPAKAWRQVSAVPREPIKIDELVFANLFPDAAIDAAKFEGEFPFIPAGSHQEEFKPTSQGWVGRTSSVREMPGIYLWNARRDGSFAYREPIWEAQSIRGKHLHIRPIMALACVITAFIPKLARKVGLDDSVAYTLAFEFEGIRERGLVTPVLPLDCGKNNEPERTWTQKTLRVEVAATVGEMRQDIVNTSIRLVNEVARCLAPSLLQQGKLLNLLKQFHKEEKDSKNTKSRYFGVLDGYL